MLPIVLMVTVPTLAVLVGAILQQRDRNAIRAEMIGFRVDMGREMEDFRRSIRKAITN